MNGFIRRTIVSLAVLVTVAGAPDSALAWAAGTHAYIAKHTNKMGGLVSDAELCRRVLGANGPDLFNSTWTNEAQLLALVLHTTDATPNLAPYGVADGALEREYGFGFASHNNAWGTDSTAHVAGRTFGQDVGYVVAKADVLGGLLAPSIGAALGIPADAALPMAKEVSHNFVEFAVDFLLAKADPQLGATLYGSSRCYLGGADDAFLAKALAPWMAPALAQLPDPPADPEGAVAQAIRDVEGSFVAGLGQNGQLLAAPYEVGMPILAYQTAVQAQQYLTWRYPELFPEPPPLSLLVPLVEIGIDAAMQLCAPDFMDEIEATIGRVNGEMSSRGITP